MATVADLVEVYVIGRVRRREITVLTARNLRVRLDQFAKACGDRPVSRISSREVERWQEDYGANLAPATRRQSFGMIRRFCRWLIQEKHLRRDPTFGMPLPKEPRSLPRALRSNAVGQILAHCPDVRARLVALLMVQEGLRCMEVAGLQIGDIDFLDATMRVVGKGGHERVLPVTEECMEAIHAYLDEHPAASGPLVRSYRDPEHPLAADTLGRYLAAVMYSAGVKRRPRDRVSAHALRHTMATDTLRRGAHVRDVQALLGHAHLQTTETYLPAIVGDLRAALGGRRYRGAQHTTT